MSRIRESKLNVVAGLSPNLAAGPVAAPDIEVVATPTAIFFNVTRSAQGTAP